MRHYSDTRASRRRKQYTADYPTDALTALIKDTSSALPCQMTLAPGEIDDNSPISNGQVHQAISAAKPAPRDGHGWSSRNRGLIWNLCAHPGKPRGSWGENSRR